MERREVLGIIAAGALANSPPAWSGSTQGIATFPFQQVDVFSSVPLGGNPLAVVVGADALTEKQMGAFANWTNLSETTFLVKPTKPEADYRVRIFTREQELSFAAGHPTLGSCYAWLNCGGQPKRQEIVQECAATLTPIRRASGRLSFAAAKLIREGPLEPDVLARVIDGLHLAPDAIVASSWVDNGPGWLAILLRSRQEVLALRPEYSRIAGLRVGVLAPWDPEKDGSDAQFEVRAFSAAVGGFEDPVTGSLNAGLAMWLIGSGRARSRYIASQGTALGRMGRVLVERDGDQTWIGGAVSPCITGVLSL
jgi:PhzF family phenazine biosynthesis protein